MSSFEMRRTRGELRTPLKRTRLVPLPPPWPWPPRLLALLEPLPERFLRFFLLRFFFLSSRFACAPPRLAECGRPEVGGVDEEDISVVHSGRPGGGFYF